jgi:tellurite resistance protein TerC
MGMFHLLHYGLSGILIFVGLKMVLSDLFHLPIVVSLLVVAGLLAASVVGSLMWPKRTPLAPKERAETDV